MFYRLGLRSEIVLQLFLLTAAAIIFISILITKASEQELLQQRVLYNTSLVKLLGQNLELKTLSTSEIELSLNNIIERYHQQHGLQALAVLGREQNASSSKIGDIRGWPDNKEADIARLSRNMSSRIRYHGFLEGMFTTTTNYLLVTLPLRNNTNNAVSLQAYFSLDDISARVFKAHGSLLPYLFIVGLILVLFGSYLLGKAVVQPIRMLQLASQKITSGDLDQTVPATGPKEIYKLMEHFNEMSNGLQQSRREAEAHIQSLKQINHELEQTRGELVQSEKMASIGHLAAGIAHEIGNPLGALLGYLELLTDQHHDPALVKDIVNRSLHESKRIDQLVRDLLDYARPQEDEQASCLPDEIIRDTLNLLDQQESLHSARVMLNVPDKLPEVPISKRKLQQVLINLLLNARDASVQTDNIDLAVEKEEDRIKIMVKDHGAGIPEDNLSHLFDPFFTTKPQGKGRGLGLFIAHRIISDVGGRIEVESEANQGTRFTILLPITESIANEA